MSSEHMIKSYDEELRRLNNTITEMGGLAESQLATAIEAVNERDSDLAASVVEGDVAVDQLQHELDNFAVRLLALRQPVGSDLRGIFAAVKIGSDLERICDYAANIAKRSIALNQAPPVQPIHALTRMARQAQLLVKDVIDAYVERDADKAYEVWMRDEELDEMYASLFRVLLTYMMEDPRNIGPSTHLLFMAKNIERIGDHATNIAEDLYLSRARHTPGAKAPQRRRYEPAGGAGRSTGSGASMTKPLVLIVEDEAPLVTLLRYNLEKEGFDVSEAADGEEALVRIAEHKPDIVLLDWMLPLVSGIEVCRQIRRMPQTRTLPVVMLTARGEEADRVRGLDSGADDYIAKPFGLRELAARLRAVIRRAQPTASEETLQFGQVTMDLAAHRVSRSDKPIHLGPTEFRLLRHLMQHPGRVFSREQLLDAVWGHDVYVEARTVDVHIRRLRKALNADGGADLVRTVRSAGYALDQEAR